MTTTEYRKAPEGFSKVQWATFQRDGILVVEHALTEDEIATYRDGIARVTAAEGSPRSDGFFETQNFVEKDPVFASLIDHPSHVGLVYDLYGEQLKLQVKVGYWLTDIPEPEMGNLVYVPGSHRHPYFEAYDTDEDTPGQVPLSVPRGAMTLFNCSLWHRTAPNNSAVTRKNLYLGYCPSWIPSYDRTTSDPAWLATLNREQRIIMRSYRDPYNHAKHPLRTFHCSWTERPGWTASRASIGMWCRYDIGTGPPHWKRWSADGAAARRGASVGFLIP